MGAQAWGLAAKLREADQTMTSEHQSVIYEVHPEVSFWAMREKVPMRYSKKSSEGASERMEALIESGFPRMFVEQLPSDFKVGRDDFLDACAAAWTAQRIALELAERFPIASDRDACGLDMAIWF